jgi:hypothetical protein
MPRINFAEVDNVQDFSPVPQGKYPCRLVEVEEASTQYGDEMWKLKFEITEGEYAGRFIFDNMVFSEAAMKRVKLICSRLGLNTSGEVDLTPGMLEGCSCLLSVEVEDYEDHEGRIKKRNVVPFAGYERANAADHSVNNGLDESELPF